jgi:hypothetical protein
MQIVYHIGAHCTDDERLLKALFKNREALGRQGVAVPGPSRYRKIIRETIQGLDHGPPAPDAREILLDSILEQDGISRLVMSNPNFICVPPRIFEKGVFYGLATEKVSGLARLFPGDEIEYFIGVRNFATWLPELARHGEGRSLDELMGGLAPQDLRWSEVIARIRAADPHAALTVWANEDTPLLWSEILRDISGLDPAAPLAGGFDLLSEIMSEEGMARFRAYLKSHPPQTEIQKRRVIAAFLDKFARPEAIEEEIDLPGWDDALVDDLTALYEQDLYEIARVPGVTLITP